MRTRLFEGAVQHTRFHPTPHHFEYSYPMLLLDLDEAAEIDGKTRLFGWNRARVFTVSEREYFLPGPSTLKERVVSLLEKEGFDTDRVKRLSILTVPSFFGWGFNPVSFYFCEDGEGCVPFLLAEVNNTFRERHLYLLQNSNAADRQGNFHSSSDKVFHVSPFFPREGEYRFDFTLDEDRVDALIEYSRYGQQLLSARLLGRLTPFTSSSLRWTALRRPFVRLLTTARIHVQAARLYFRLRLPYHPKPEPASPLTFPQPRMNRLDRVAKRVLGSHLTRLAEGGLRIQHADGSSERFGREGEDSEIILRVHSPRFYRRTVLGGDVGFGESYVQGDWTTNDLSGLIRLLIRNREAMSDYNFPLQRLIDAVGRVWPAWLRHGRSGSRRDIAAHYDLSNDFFRLFLDPTMTYSCAYFPNDQTPLIEAQLAKIDRIVDLAEIDPSDRVLEIGSGWGALAKRLAERIGCGVTSVTLSLQQYEYARGLMERHRLEEKVRIEYQDYRDVGGLYDRIVSVEMLEAVGFRNLPVFFRTCQDRLKAGGKTVLQVITISEKHFEAYRRGRDFIRKHIFPGGFLPSVSALEEVVRRNTDFTIRHIEDIGPHYGTTLREWRVRLLANRDKVLELGFDESFLRKWLYYFAYCEAAFDTRTLGVQQIVLERRP